MLLLLFTLGQYRYALDARAIIEVVPLAELKAIPRAPDYVAGILNYRGTNVPVLDLTRMNQAQPSRACMSTRIILVDYRDSAGAVHILGLMAERVTETVKKAQSEFTPSGVSTPDAPYLGDVANDALGMIQQVDVGRLVPSEVRALLFSHVDAA